MKAEAHNHPVEYRRIKRVALPLFVVYLLVLLKLLFFKITFAFSDIAITDNKGIDFETLLAGSSFVPFYRIHYYLSGQEPYLVGLLNIAGNVILFVPMGIFLPLLFRNLQTGRRVGAVVGLLSLCVEILQLFTATGQFDVDDVILNTLGGLAGYGIFRAVCATILRRQETAGSNAPDARQTETQVR